MHTHQLFFQNFFEIAKNVRYHISLLKYGLKSRSTYTMQSYCIHLQERIKCYLQKKDEIRDC